VRRSRRAFLLAGGAGALLLGWLALPPRGRIGSAALLNPASGEVALNGWVKLSPDGTVAITVPRAEMGQGVHTALPMLLAEELEVPMASVRVEHAGLDRIYGNVAMLTAGLPFHPRDQVPEQATLLVRVSQHVMAKAAREMRVIVTGGSSSVSDAWDVMRTAGALAREALRAAGAKRLGVAPDDCRCENGAVIAGTRRMSYAEIARSTPDLASFAPSTAKLKPASAWKLIGKPVPRLDVPAKVDGRAIFAIDVRPPGMLYAAAAMCPVLGGSVKRVTADAVLGMPGVKRVVVLPAERGASGGVAVIAQTWWHAKQALDRLPVEWEEGANATFDSARHREELVQAIRSRHGFALSNVGGAPRVIADAGRRLEAWYSAPYLAHATMEPMNCTAQFRDGKAIVWAATQVPAFARAAAATALGIAESAVELREQLLGGGFGRRLEVDIVAQAARVAREAGGVPVQLVWPRDQDMAHDFYRPMQVARMAGALEGDRLLALSSHTAGESITPNWLSRNSPWLMATPPDKTQVEGLYDIPYDIRHQRMEHVTVASPVPVGFWRSVGHSMNAFFVESFIDEMAVLAGADPLAFRLAMLVDAPRHRSVLERCAREAGWGKPLAPGRARGLALAESFGSIVAQVAEISVDTNTVRVNEVTAVIDCGTPVNPGIIAQQMESGVIFGLSAALHGEIVVRNGRVQQTGFADYPIGTLAQSPKVRTFIIASEARPGGVGEPGVPPIAPAVANAIHAATGKRLRSLPLRLA
jgi:isoquinoline 1-oxidoreductase beta subunit